MGRPAVNTKAEKILDEAVPVYSILKAGNNPRESWTLIADKIIAARKADPDATQKEIGARFGESQNWVSDVLSWRKNRYHARDTPFARDDWEHRKKQIATRTPVKHADRVKMAEELLEDPKVVESVLAQPSVVARGVANAVLENEARERRKVVERVRAATAQRTASAPPMSAAVSSMVTKINDWALALDGTHEIAEELPPGRSTDIVAMALHNLDRATHDWLQLIEGVSGSRLRVIEGQAG